MIRLYRFFLLLSFALCCFIPETPQAAELESVYRLAFTPFDVQSAGQYDYLGGSVQTMLMSRLSSQKNIEIVDRILTRNQLAELRSGDGSSARKPLADIDYIATGGLYAMQQGLGIQVDLYPPDYSGDVLHFSDTAKTASDVIPVCERLLSLIVKRLEREQNPAVNASISKNDGLSAFRTSHPEEDYKKKTYFDDILEVGNQDAQRSGKIRKAESRAKVSIPQALIDCVEGDFDGDGIEEIVAISSSRLLVYRLTGRALAMVEEKALPDDMKVHRLYAADLNEDGRDELYLNATVGLRVASRILEWNNSYGLTMRARAIGYHIRPVKMPGAGWLLLGQKQGKEKTRFLGKDVFLLKSDNGNVLVESGKVALPEGCNLFNFTFAELDNQEGEELVILDSSGKIRVYNSSNELLYVSEDRFSGGSTYIGPSIGESVDEQSSQGISLAEDENRELEFIPPRLIAVDIDADGKDEIVVSRHEEGLFGLFKRLRALKDGSLVGLVWDGSRLYERWRSKTFTGYIADYFFRPYDRKFDTGVEGAEAQAVGVLGIASIANDSLTSMFFKDDTTVLTLYEIEYSRKSENTQE